MFHIFHHEGEVNECEESGASTIRYHLHWEKAFTDRIIHRLTRTKLVETDGCVIRLTQAGRSKSQKDYEELFG